jgi:hypothetical protein
MYDIVMWIIMGAVVVGILCVEGCKATGTSFDQFKANLGADLGAAVFAFLFIMTVIIAVRGF